MGNVSVHRAGLQLGDVFFLAFISPASLLLASLLFLLFSGLVSKGPQHATFQETVPETDAS